MSVSAGAKPVGQQQHVENATQRQLDWQLSGKLLQFSLHIIRLTRSKIWQGLKEVVKAHDQTSVFEGDTNVSNAQLNRHKRQKICLKSRWREAETAYCLLSLWQKQGECSLASLYKLIFQDCLWKMKQYAHDEILYTSAESLQRVDRLDNCVTRMKILCNTKIVADSDTGKLLELLVQF